MTRKWFRAIRNACARNPISARPAMPDFICYLIDSLHRILYMDYKPIHDPIKKATTVRLASLGLGEPFTWVHLMLESA